MPAYLIPEVVSYFFAAIGGAILYINITKHKNKNAIKDSMKLLFLAFILILAGAVIETLILS